jgi:hypothetical protein
MGVFPSELIYPFPFFAGFNVYSIVTFNLSYSPCVEHIDEGRDKTQNSKSRGQRQQWNFKTSMIGYIILPEVSRLWYSCRIRNHENHDV